MSETQWNFPRFVREGLDNQKKEDDPAGDDPKKEDNEEEEEEEEEENGPPSPEEDAAAVKSTATAKGQTGGGSRHYVRNFNTGEYDQGENTTKYDDELIMTGQFVEKDDGKKGPPTEDPTPPNTDEENDDLDPYTLWMRGASFSTILRSAGRSPYLMLRKLARIIARFITRLYYQDMKTDEARQTSGILETQILRIFLYFISLFMALNLWYCWFHSTYTFEFVSLLSYGVLKPFYLILQPILMAGDCATYVLHNAFREQNEATNTIKGLLRDYRTFALVLLTVCVGGILSAIHAMVTAPPAKPKGGKRGKGGKGAQSNTSTRATPFAALSILMFLMASAQNEFYARFNIFGVILLLLIFVMKLAMVPFMEVFFILYFTVFLNWFLIIHGTMRCGSLWGAINMIFEDLHDAPISGDPSNIIYKIKSFFVQHVYDIFIKSSLIGIFSVGINESRKNLRNRGLANAMTAAYVGGIALCVIPLIYSFRRAFFEQSP